MAWIESHQELGGHPKLRRLAERLRVPIPQALGHLHLLWYWAVDYAPDGDLGKYEAAEIAEPCRWSENPALFLEALEGCGWLDRLDEHLLIHDWWAFAGRLIGSRVEAAEAGALGNHTRWHQARGKVDPSCSYCRPISGGDSGSDSPDGKEAIGATRTVHNPTAPDSTQPDQEPKARPAAPTSPADFQTGLLRDLHIGDERWTAFTFGALVKLNSRYGRETVTMALQRAREEKPELRSGPYPLIEAMCKDIRAKQGAA